MPNTEYREDASMFTVPKSKQIRLIVDTDARCEADDAFAIVHDLLTPQF